MRFSQPCEVFPGAPTLFVVGDSHALALAPLLEDFALTTGWHVSLYDNAGCPYLSLRLIGTANHAVCVTSKRSPGT
ncbi:SGNH hydrolase domain-containing protein [Luteibacter sahnii]|uniref:SGNH hydrolase domain-containing protein n=1 Tax=Luteibacter sahnii TaxID=3021977 RepID=UPI0034E0CF7D